MEKQTFCSFALAVLHTSVPRTGSNSWCQTASYPPLQSPGTPSKVPFLSGSVSRSLLPSPQPWVSWSGGGKKRSCFLYLCGGFIDFPLLSCPDRDFFFFLIGCIQGMWKLLGQGSNLSHSSNPSHSGDNAGSLTPRPPGNWQGYFFSHIQVGSSVSKSWQ